MIKKIIQIFKIAFGKGLPKLPPRETWPVRFLLASEEPWALNAILRQFKENPQKILKEICPSGLSGMMLYRLWQQGFYTNDSWEKNPKCSNARILECENVKEHELVNEKLTQLRTSEFTNLDRLIKVLEKQRLKDLGTVAQRKLAMQELDQWVADWNQEKFGNKQEKWVKPIIIKGAATSVLYYPEESLRPSLDIDVLMPLEMLDDFAQEENWNRYVHDEAKRWFCNYCIEGHRWISENDSSIDYELIEDGAVPLSTYKFLRYNKKYMRYIILTHFAKHWGVVNYDLIDLVMIESVNDNESLKQIIESCQRKHVLNSFKSLAAALLLDLSCPKLVGKKKLLARKLEALYFSSEEVGNTVFNILNIYVGGLVSGNFFCYTVIKNWWFDLDRTRMEFRKDLPVYLLWPLHFTYVPTVRFIRVIRRLLSFNN